MKPLSVEPDSVQVLLDPLCEAVSQGARTLLAEASVGSSANTVVYMATKMLTPATVVTRATTGTGIDAREKGVECMVVQRAVGMFNAPWNRGNAVSTASEPAEDLWQFCGVRDPGWPPRAESVFGLHC